MEDQIKDQNNQVEVPEQTEEQVEEKEVLNVWDYFGLDKKEDNLYSNKEKTLKKFEDTLGFGLKDMAMRLNDWMQKHSEELTLDLASIAPFGDYSKLLENNDEMSDFIKKNCVTEDVWDLFRVSATGEMFKFEFRCKATDAPKSEEEEEGYLNYNVIGIVLVGSKSKKIRHAFVQSNL